MKRARAKQKSGQYAGRGGLKLEFALDFFKVNVGGLVAADFGCHRGGFSDCLLKRGVARVHAVDTAYGILDWKLRQDPRIVLHERTNLIYWTSPEALDLVVIDAGWTPQRLSLPAAERSLKPEGIILSLVKPQYEVDKARLRHGVLAPEELDAALSEVRAYAGKIVEIIAEARSPIAGSGGNVEFWFYARHL